MLETRKLVRAFANLPAGWHFGKGGPISEEVRTQCLIFLHAGELLNIREAEAFPSETGEVELAFYIGDSELAIRVHSSESVSVTIEDEQGQIVDEQVRITPLNAIVKLWEFSRRKPTTSGLFTFIGGPSVKDGSGMKLSNLRRKRLTPKKDYPSYATSVYQLPAELCMSMRDISTVA